MSSLHCAACGERLRIDANYCRACGAPVDRVPCGSCGQPVAVTRSACAGCGAPVPVAEVTTRTRQSRRRAGRPAAIAGAVVALVVVASIAAMAAGGFSDWGEPEGGATGRKPDNGSRSTSNVSSPGTGTVTLPPGSWVVIVESLAQTENSLEQARAKAAAKSEALGTTVEVVDSIGDAGLQDGYWALVVGPFDTEDEAKAACSDLGLRLGSDCYPKQAGG